MQITPEDFPTASLSEAWLLFQIWELQQELEWEPKWELASEFEWEPQLNPGWELMFL